MYYRYSVLLENGSEINGIETGSYSEIKKILLEKKYYILYLEPDILESVKGCFGKKKIKSQTLSTFFEDMLNMLNMGISVREAVFNLEESANDAFLAKALCQAGYDLDRGFSLSQALTNTDCFPNLALSTLKVGEKSGQLEEVFGDLHRYYLRQADFSRGLANAFIYPLVVFSMLIGIMFYVSFKVIPHLELLLPIREKSFLAARLLLGLAHFLRCYWFVCLLLPVVAAFVYSHFKKMHTDQIESLQYKIPLVGEVMKSIDLSVLFSSLAVLQKSGINIAEGLGLLYETATAGFLARKVLKVKNSILAGKSFHQALGEDKFFPNEVCSAVKKGEEMARLEEYLYRISEDYFKKAARNIQLLLSLIQPALLVICAVFLLLIVSAFIIPVYSSLSNIAGGNIKF